MSDPLRRSKPPTHSSCAHLIWSFNGIDHVVPPGEIHVTSTYGWFVLVLLWHHEIRELHCQWILMNMGISLWGVTGNIYGYIAKYSHYVAIIYPLYYISINYGAIFPVSTGGVSLDLLGGIGQWISVKASRMSLGIPWVIEYCHGKSFRQLKCRF